MTDPLVCAICLTRNRPEMTRRAIECFRRQTYANRWLLIYDTGNPVRFTWSSQSPVIYVPGVQSGIGQMRNSAIEAALSEIRMRDRPLPDIFMTWDSDDWSHPARIAEQVALLQSSGAELVGYSELLFWDCREYAAAREAHEHRIPINSPADAPFNRTGTMVSGQVNEAWIFRREAAGHPSGTSHAFWRSTWERRPYPDWQSGEDFPFAAGRKIAVEPLHATEPRMIATLHGGNTMAEQYARAIGTSPAWSRVPEWDRYCRENLK